MNEDLILVSVPDAIFESALSGVEGAQFVVWDMTEAPRGGASQRCRDDVATLLRRKT